MRRQFQRGTFIQHNCCARRQAGDKILEHHPARSGVIEEDVGGGNVTCEMVFTEGIEEHSALTMLGPFCRLAFGWIGEDGYIQQ